jgi:hypothetical protein
MTESMFSRLSEIETSLQKVDKLDALMQQIAAKMGLIAALPPSSNTPAVPPETVHAPAAASAHYVSESPSSSMTTPSRPGDARPSTNGGASPSSTTPHEIRQSPAVTVNADVSLTDVGRAG